MSVLPIDATPAMAIKVRRFLKELRLDASIRNSFSSVSAVAISTMFAGNMVTQKIGVFPAAKPARLFAAAPPARSKAKDIGRRACRSKAARIIAFDGQI